MIKDDFDYELSIIDFGFKSLIVQNQVFKHSLFEEFRLLTPMPKLHLYINAHISDEERKADYEINKNKAVRIVSRYNSQLPIAANFYNHTELESKELKLIHEFNDKLSTNSIDERYWGRFIKETRTVIILDAVASIINTLKKYVLSEATEDSYYFFASSTCENIASKVNELKIPGLREAILQSILSDEDNLHITIKYLSTSNDIVQRQKAIERYERLKTYTDSFLSKELSQELIIPQATKEEKLTPVLYEFGFFELPKVKILSHEAQLRLVESISNSSMPYTIAMFDFLGYLTYLRKNYFATNVKLHKTVAKWLGLDERGVRGNINVLNPKSKEKRMIFTAHLHTEDVVLHYQQLKQGVPPYCGP